MSSGLDKNTNLEKTNTLAYYRVYALRIHTVFNVLAKLDWKKIQNLFVSLSR